MNREQYEHLRGTINFFWTQYTLKDGKTTPKVYEAELCKEEYFSRINLLQFFQSKIYSNLYLCAPVDQLDFQGNQDNKKDQVWINFDISPNYDSLKLLSGSDKEAKRKQIDEYNS